MRPGNGKRALPISPKIGQKSREGGKTALSPQNYGQLTIQHFNHQHYYYYPVLPELILFFQEINISSGKPEFFKL